jgi:glutathione S-transferase
MKLYYAPGACSLSPHIIAREAGIPIELVKVEFGKDGAKSAQGKDFLKINPKGYVPALELDSGQIITEGPVIAQYLADQKPDSGLAPKHGTLERYRVMEWLTFINSELHKVFASLFNPNAAEAEKQGAVATLQKRFNFVNQGLVGKPYLEGKQFTVADAYLFVVLTWTGFVKFDLAGYPELTAFMQRVSQRQKVQEALKAEGLA